MMEQQEIIAPRTHGRDEENGYANFLREELGVQMETRTVWASCGNTPLIQGWKLHLSTIPTESLQLLRTVVPFLVENKISFKIAKDEAALSSLNEGSFGHSQVGKFMTIYPPQEDVRSIAEALIRVTENFRGPVIPSDMRLGAIVYTRFGGFNPLVQMDRLGQTFLCIHYPDGSLRTDAYKIPYEIPEGVDNPFEGISYAEKEEAIVSPSPRLFGPGYLVVDMIRSNPKGSIFRSIDLRSQEDAGIKVLKQGRQFTYSDEYGRDIRTRLQHQEKIHCALCGKAPVPNAGNYFEVKGDGYLPIEFIEGKTIEQIAYDTLQNGCFTDLDAETQIRLLGYLDQLAAAVKQLHDAGYMHRDISASNVWISAEEKVFLLDLELAHKIGDEEPHYTLGTLGFISPNQAARKAPQPVDDIYSTGCAMILLLTGIDPRRVLFGEEKDRVAQLSGLLNGEMDALAEMVAACVSEDPASRPATDEIRACIQNCITELRAGKNRKADPGKKAAYDLQQLIARAQQGLVHETMREERTGLWLSPAFEEHEHLARKENAAGYELLADGNRGIAGVVYALSRLARNGHGSEDAEEKIRGGVKWLLRNVKVEDSRLPGLHFGFAGAAVAIGEAIRAGIVEKTEVHDAFIRQALSGRLDWPDVTHGAAGQGIAVFYCADALEDPSLEEYAHRCADYLMQTQLEDGSWCMPEGVDGMSGQVLTGFAHGVAGMVYFLAEYDRRFNHPSARDAWRKGAAWLIAQSIPGKDGTLEWSYATTEKSRWFWWCHGSPGIALTFLRLYEQTGEQLFADTAERALLVHPRRIIYPNLSQCHGLSGLGDAYVEAWRVLGDREWRERAEWIADVMYHLRREREKGITWLVEDAHAATADLMVGGGGVAHFLLRLSMEGQHAGLPLMLDPIK